MANIADVLGAMSRGTGGLRSGPAGNKQWATAFALLEEGAIFEGIEALRAIRHKWLVRPDHQVRAARHYEGAAQILIRHAVMTGRKVRILADPASHKHLFQLSISAPSSSTPSVVSPL